MLEKHLSFLPKMDKKLTKEKVVNFAVRAVFNFISEFLGTASFMFVGCMSCVEHLGPPAHLFGLALSFSFAIMTGIEIALHMSGGHINPILTVVGVFFKRVSIPMAVVYIIAQICGSILGVGLVKVLTPNSPDGLCCTVRNPEVSIVQAVFVEFLTSSILVLFVCAQWDPRNKLFESITLKIGFVAFCLAYASVPYTGCSMNPARSFGPAIWNNVWKDHWIYWLSPTLASLIWSPIYVKVFMIEVENKNEGGR